MEIIFPEYYGWCFGVLRAVELTYQTLEKKNFPTYALSEIIHSPQETQRMKERGLNFIPDLSQIKDNSNLIIGAFGISSYLRSQINQSKITVIDATCPYVREVFYLTEKLKRDGYYVVIVGNRKHIEVQNILSYIEGEAIVVDNCRQLKNISLPHRVGVVSQTTQPINTFKKVVSNIVEKAKEVKVHRTICYETVKRQASAQDIASKVDIMLVIGGRHSENTKNLYRLCKRINVNTYHLEDEKDLPLKMLKRVQKVGITSGASTPQWIIDKVVEKIKIITAFKME